MESSVCKTTVFACRALRFCHGERPLHNAQAECQLGYPVFTTIIFAHNAQGWFFDLARKKLAESPDKEQVTIRPGTYAEYAPEGLAIKYSTRVLRMPSELTGSEPIRLVEIEHAVFDGSWVDLNNKKVQRRRSWACMTSGGSKASFLIVKGKSLGTANSLYQAILDKTAVWR